MNIIHLKVMRVYIDGVLRFGIPPTFYMCTIKPKGSEQRVLDSLTKAYAEPD